MFLLVSRPQIWGLTIAGAFTVVRSLDRQSCPHASDNRSPPKCMPVERFSIYDSCTHNHEDASIAMSVPAIYRFILLELGSIGLYHVSF